MSYGPDNIITNALVDWAVSNPSLLAEEVIEALEAEDYWIVHKSQVRDRDELLRAIHAEQAEL